MMQDRQVSGGPSKQSPRNGSHVEGQHSKVHMALLRAGIRNATTNSPTAKPSRKTAQRPLFKGDLPFQVRVTTYRNPERSGYFQ
jgi:hypothetical protein